MKAVYVSVFMLVIALWVVQSNASQQASLPIAEPGVQKNYLGFSIMSPEGGNWYFQEEAFDGITFTKSVADGGRHTILLFARSKPVEFKPDESNDFFLYIKRAYADKGENSRFKGLSTKISPITIDGVACAKVEFSTDDRGVPWAAGSAYELHGYDIVCRHPHSPQTLVVLGYSQRYEKGRTPIAIDKEVISFVESLRFSADIRKRFSIGPLLGVFAYDKALFFPNGRDQDSEAYWLSALREGGCTDAEAFSVSEESVQKLAVKYDIAWLMSSEKEVRHQLGCVLGKVARWSEAFQAFKAASRSNPGSAEIMGYAGVAAHVTGRYQDSIECFQKAIALEPGYFEKRPRQKMIYSASERGVSALNR
jgi:hypothetical protein